MSDIHYYYLHTNGDLIHKRFRPDPSDFVVKIWDIDITDRGNAWTLVIDAARLGARQSRIDELVEKWGLTNEDAEEYAKVVGFTIGKDGHQFFVHQTKGFVDIQESQTGFGDTVFNAFVDYAKQGNG